MKVLYSKGPVYGITQVNLVTPETIWTFSKGPYTHGAQDKPVFHADQVHGGNLVETHHNLGNMLQKSKCIGTLRLFALHDHKQNIYEIAMSPQSEEDRAGMLTEDQIEQSIAAFEASLAAYLPVTGAAPAAVPATEATRRHDAQIDDFLKDLHPPMRNTARKQTNLQNLVA